MLEWQQTGNCSLYLHETTQEMEEKEKELNCWNNSVLEKPKREIASNKLHLNILLDFARKPIIHKEKK